MLPSRCFQGKLGASSLKANSHEKPLKIGKLAPKIRRSAIVFQPSPFFLVYNSYYNLRKLVSFREGFWCKLAQVGFREGFWLACFVPPHSLKAVWASSSLSGSSSSPSWSQPFQLMLRFFHLNVTYGLQTRKRKKTINKGSCFWSADNDADKDTKDIKKCGPTHLAYASSFFRSTSAYQNQRRFFRWWKGWSPCQHCLPSLLLLFQLGQATPAGLTATGMMFQKKSQNKLHHRLDGV